MFPSVFVAVHLASNISVNLFIPTFFSDCGKMSLYQSIQHYTGLTHHFLVFFDIRALRRSGLSGRVPKCQKFFSGLVKYGAKRFEV